MRSLATLVLLFGVAAALAAAPEEAPPAQDALSAILNDLQGVEAEMTVNQERISALNQKILQLQTLGKTADDEIRHLQDLVEEHAERVRQLGDRYSKVLVLAQKLKNDLQFSATLNYVLGGATVVAVLVAIGEGVALATR